MHMVYNSDSFAVVQHDLPGDDAIVIDGDTPLVRGGFEIVDKFARQEIFLEGLLAESFRDGVQALAETRPSEEEIDDYIAGFAQLGRRPLTVH